MTVAFKYRIQSGAGEWHSVEKYSSLRLGEGQRYLLKFEHPIGDETAKELASVDCEKLDEGLYALRIINFAGEFTLSTVQVHLLPSKFTASNMSQMLEEISEVSSSLLFGWGAPTLFETQSNATAHNPPPYHQLQFLRQNMLKAEVGDRLQDYFRIIEHNPANEFERNRKPVALSHVKHLDSRAMQQLVSHPAKLARVKTESGLYNSTLAIQLTFGSPPCRHLPIEVWQPSKQLSHDTFENRFVKRVLQECTDLVNRFVVHPKLHQSMRNDCQKILSELTALSESPFLDGLSPLDNFSSPTQALLKAEGYRGVFSFWMRYIQHRSLPLDNVQTVELLEGKNLALLYEYWVFIQVIQAVALALGVPHVRHVSVIRDELGDRLSHSLCITFNENVSVKFNQSYTRSKETSYSTPLRPDVILSVSDKDFVFDAKYKMTKASFAGDTEDDGLYGVYKRADLYKMHAYRDAIYNAKAAFAAYPGSESVFFTSEGAKINPLVDGGCYTGVGAIALQPGKDNHALKNVVSELIHHKI